MRNPISEAILLALARTKLSLSGLYRQKRTTVPLVMLFMLLLSACGNKTDIITIEANQTAFLIPIAGDTTQQAQLQSIDYLKKNQVASKQVSIPYEWRQTGSSLGIFATGDWYPTVKLVLVDRNLVTREWTKSVETGTSATDQAFGVESSESIDFRIGATCTAYIDESDAATYLYYYGTKPLNEVMDTNVRGFIQGELFNEFGSRTLAQGQVDKKLIFQAVTTDTTTNFKARGITILAFGGEDGMTYTDPKIQAAINDSYASQQKIIQAQAAATQQGYVNQQLISQANAAATATVIAGGAAAQVMQQSGQMLQQYPALTGYTIALRSSGQVPQILVLGGNQTGNLPFSFFIPVPSAIPTVPAATSTPTGQ
ncbi:MAG: hypothetical protein ACYDEO_11035 [Aggregatilineales bacterium]